MTIALAAFGTNAGKAVYCGLLAAEILGRGAIGGFVVSSILDGQGAHHQLTCQDGGITALDGVMDHQSAKCAAVISSGPNRPEPLSQFLAGRSGLGLVTGHRLPSRAGDDGQPVNLAVLELMAAGIPTSDAIDAIFRDNPELDAGLIAVQSGGPLVSGNSARVSRRNDVLSATRQESAHGYALLCNSIYTAREVLLEAVVGAIMWENLTGECTAFFISEFVETVPIQPGDADRIDLDPKNRVIGIQIAEPTIGTTTTRTTVIHAGAPVWQDGRCIGTCISEVFAAVTGANARAGTQFQSRFIVERA